MLILLFLAASLAASLYLFFITGFSIRKALLTFALVFLALNLCYLLVLWVATLTFNSKQALTKQNSFCRAACVGVASLALGYSWVRTHISGAEKLPEDVRFLLVSNHRSGYDPLIILKKLKKYNISCISKSANMELPVIGRVAYGAGFLPIDREDNRSALKTILTAVDYIKRDICSMAIYPEGTRTKTGELGEFHAGSFKIAQKADVPLVISAVYGTEKVKKNILRRVSHVHMDILEVVPADRVKAMSTRELSDYSKNVIAAHLASVGA